MLVSLCLLAAAPLPPQEDPLAVPVLEQEGRTWTAREVLEARAEAFDRTLLTAVERDAEYRRVYLRSTAFLTEVQAFSDHLILDRAGIPAADQEARLAEAVAWAADRGMKGAATGVLAAHGFEIDNRARLIALQPAEFSTQELRQHMLSSVPEFFHELALSWIRLPLFDATEQRALGQDERKAQYDTLAEAAAALEAGELSWEEAVERYAVVPDDRARQGYVGLVKRTMVGRFEEPLLRQVFADLGYKMPEGKILRGPILGEKWAYLVQIDTVRVHPIVDLNLVRDRVERSRREKLLREKLQELRSGVDRRLLAPVR